MILVYNPVALWFACAFTGGAVALLYSLAATWRIQGRLQSSREPFSREPFQGVGLAAIPEPARRMVQEALAFRARKPAPLWHLLIMAVVPVALARHFYQCAFYPALPAAVPTVIVGRPLLLLMMGVGFCLIPVVSVASVEVACRKVRRNLRRASGVEPAV